MVITTSLSRVVWNFWAKMVVHAAMSWEGYLVPLRATCINYEDIHPFGTNVEKRAQKYTTYYSAVVSIRSSL